MGRRGPNPGNSLHINIHVNLVEAIILTVIMRDYLQAYKAFYELIFTWKHALCGGLSGSVEPILLTTLRVDP